MNRVLLQQAKEALERSLSWINSGYAAKQVQEAIEALRVELAKPETAMKFNIGDYVVPIHFPTAQPRKITEVYEHYCYVEQVFTLYHTIRLINIRP